MYRFKTVLIETKQSYFFIFLCIYNEQIPDLGRVLMRKIEFHTVSL